MTEPPFPEETEVKGDVLSASKSYRKSESCFETPRSSEEHPGIGPIRSSMTRDGRVFEATPEITHQTWSNWEYVSCE